MKRYDRLAEDFDRRRPLPEGVPSAVRTEVLAALPDQPTVLDLGCGTGRMGWPFVLAGDHYVAVDASLGMLRAFASRRLNPVSLLIQADGARLPFRDARFDAVLLVQVLSGTSSVLDLLHEVRRVLRRDGVMFVGRSQAPADGLDARMKTYLSELLDAFGLHPYQQQAKDEARRWLDRRADRTTTEVARWSAVRTPRQFIERHGNGARFSALDGSVRTAAMSALEDWALATFGSLDAETAETQCFSLDLYKFQPEVLC